MFKLPTLDPPTMDFATKQLWDVMTQNPSRSERRAAKRALRAMGLRELVACIDVNKSGAEMMPSRPKRKRSASDNEKRAAWFESHRRDRRNTPAEPLPASIEDPYTNATTTDMPQVHPPLPLRPRPVGK